MVSSGFMTANTGRHRSLLYPRLIQPSSVVITDESLISLPAAAMVSTAPTGRAARACRFPQ